MNGRKLLRPGDVLLSRRGGEWGIVLSASAWSCRFVFYHASTGYYDHVAGSQTNDVSSWTEAGWEVLQA